MKKTVITVEELRAQAIQKQLKELKSLVKRAIPIKCLPFNNRMLIYTSRSESIVVEVDTTLWEAYNKDPQVPFDLLDPKDVNYKDYMNIFDISDGINSDQWIELEAGELFLGHKIEIRINDIEYPLTLNKTMLGIKLKKNEFTDISYRIKDYKKRLILSLKKKWDNITDKNKKEIEHTGFTLVKSFYVA